MSDAFRVRLCEWLTRNGIDIRDVPIRQSMRLVNGLLHLKVYVRDDQGNRILDPDSDLVLLASKTVVAVTPPPKDIADWLKATCPTCGLDSGRMAA